MLLHSTSVSEGSSLCQTRRTTKGQRLEPSLTLPQPPDEILKLPLVMLYGCNRHIHKTFHHPQIRGLRKVRLAFHRIQGNQRTLQTCRPNCLDGQPRVVQNAKAVGSYDDYVQADLSREITKVIVCQNWNRDTSGPFDQHA